MRGEWRAARFERERVNYTSRAQCRTGRGVCVSGDSLGKIERDEDTRLINSGKKIITLNFYLYNMALIIILPKYRTGAWWPIPGSPGNLLLMVPPHQKSSHTDGWEFGIFTDGIL